MNLQTNLSNGVTLIELMVTIAIAAILLAVVAPNMQPFLINSKLSSISTEFISTINLARSEAARLGVNVTICRRDGTSCTTSGDGNWNNGWIVWADKDADGSMDSDEKLRIAETLPDGYSLYGADPASSATLRHNIAYGRSGTATEAAIFAICHESDETQAKAVSITLTRPRTTTSTDTDGTPLKDDGTAINSCENP